MLTPPGVRCTLQAPPAALGGRPPTPLQASECASRPDIKTMLRSRGGSVWGGTWCFHAATHYALGRDGSQKGSGEPFGVSHGFCELSQPGKRGEGGGTCAQPGYRCVCCCRLHRGSWPGVGGQGSGARARREEPPARRLASQGCPRGATPRLLQASGAHPRYAYPARAPRAGVRLTRAAAQLGEKQDYEDKATPRLEWPRQHVHLKGLFANLLATHCTGHFVNAMYGDCCIVSTSSVGA